MSSRDRGPVPRPWLRGRQSSVTPDGACRRLNGGFRRLPGTVESHWCSPSRRFPRPLQPQGPADPGPARCWTPQEKHVTELDPNDHPSARAERGDPFSHLHIVPACWVSCTTIARAGWSCSPPGPSPKCATVFSPARPTGRVNAEKIGVCV